MTSWHVEGCNLYCMKAEPQLDLEIKKVFKKQIVLANALLATGAGLGQQILKNMRVEVGHFTAPQVVLGLLL